MDNSYPSSTIGGAVRWAAPELYNIPEVDQPYTPQISVSSDVYSYGSIALEVSIPSILWMSHNLNSHGQILSGKVPYHYLKHDGQVLLELSKRVKPTRPASAFLTNELWRFIGECWEDSPAARPSSLDVTSRISTLYQRTISRHSYWPHYHDKSYATAYELCAFFSRISTLLLYYCITYIHLYVKLQNEVSVVICQLNQNEM